MTKDVTLDGLDPEGRALVEAARAVSARAYSPYSALRVGAALLLDDGRTVTGCNVENASYGLTMCAERVALGASVALGLAGGQDSSRIVRVAVFCDRAEVLMPCGACRQVLAEFAEGTTEVLCASAEGPARITTVGELLPDAIGPRDVLGGGTGGASAGEQD
ncbi:cytidine deaminase [Engelhardtia mirabilis]|uniref:Cytidine deaminase n=1 Tax=Engelhardtia mirabilis TaxID=2528011 RepID=A0A518BFG2_9BACT|nr:Cytidine deaminase [Planctomycetes bacterium Pla133]QDV00037.1 Cytidine deaminase [Planctomycetes bacterium Pla86]